MCDTIVSTMAKGHVFKENQRLTGTMLTIVRQANEGSWQSIVCKCDCGREFYITYAQAYYGTRYSCGCAKKLRINATDATGQRYWNAKGNKRIRVSDGVEVSHGRALQILCRDPETQRWMYVCECCAETFIMPGGQERSPESMLRKLAGETCPNFRPFYHAAYDQMQGYWHSELGNLCMNALNRMNLYPEEIVQYYRDPSNVVRDNFGFIEGFRGQPDSPEFMKLVEKYKQKVIKHRTAMAAPVAVKAYDAPPEIIEDDFADADYAGYAPYTPPE